MAASSPHATTDTPLDKDSPLRDDIRLLGRLLGDTLRQQEGQALYELVEQVRRTAIQFARHNHPEARAAMAALGLGTQWSAIRRAGGRPMVLATVLFGWLVAGGALVKGAIGHWWG